MFHYRLMDTILSPEPRIQKKAILDAVQLAITRWPDKPIYFASDMHECPMNCKVYEGNANGKVIVTAFESDEIADKVHSVIKSDGGIFITPKQYEPPAHYLDKNSIGKKVLQEEFNKAKELKLTHFEPEDFSNIFQCLEVTRELEGCYVEIGVFRGDGARSTLRYLNDANITREVFLLDTYEGFNYPSAKESVDAQWLGTHTETSIESVKKSLSSYFGKLKVELVRSDVCRDDITFLGKIVVCNIDVDMYEAVRDALKKVAPHIVKRGIIIAEDVGHTPGLGGASLAVKEFLATAEGKKFMPYYLRSGQCLLIKVEE